MRGCLLTIMLLSVGLGASNGKASNRRITPRPLADHPGNVFLSDERVVLSLSAEFSDGWTLNTLEGPTLNSLQTGTNANLGYLSPGYYELRATLNPRVISFAVLSPLRQPTSIDSPISLDTGLTWFFPVEKMASAANLCALAGVNWVRDRLSWAELEPQPNRFMGAAQYDHAMRVWAEAGLQVLAVNHSSPAWTPANPPRLPTDLRDVHHFYQSIARRWTGLAHAFEPWNEADMAVFGAHTGAEIASFQKAAWWGIRAGNRRAFVGSVPLFYHDATRLGDFAANQPWAYFDSLNFHHYTLPADYPAIYQDFRAIAGGRPLWVTECGRPMRLEMGSKAEEPDAAALQQQAQLIGQIFSASLYEGAQQVFYFLLPAYREGQDFFGLLRPDMTPRPAYVALANVARCLAGAKSLGRQVQQAGEIVSYWFRAQPEGRSREVAVYWSDQPQLVSLPAPPLAVYDYLGRSIANPPHFIAVDAQPRFAIFPLGTAARLPLQKSPEWDQAKPNKPCSVVLQALWPSDQIYPDKSAYRVVKGQTENLPIYCYQFGPSKAVGQLRMLQPCEQLLAEKVEIKPDERFELPLALAPLAPLDLDQIQVVEIEGDFGALGKTRLSVRLKFERDTQ